MSIKSNTSIVIQHLTLQPNDLFSSLKIHNIQDFIKKINEQLSSKIRNKYNINNAGFAILKELIVEKIKTKILSITDESEKLQERIDYFEKEFLDNFISDLPLSTNTNPIINTGYNSFYKKLFKLQNTKIRQLLEKTSPNTQCSNIIGAQNKHSICYLCGCKFDKSSSSGKRKTIPHASLQCEHILPIFPAITHIMLYQTRYNPTSELQEFLKIEYAWSHMCCNLLKDDFDFTLYNSLTNKYEINQKSIKEFEKLITKKANTTHNDDKEHKISTDCKIIKDNWCDDSKFPNKEKQELQSKITNILEKINENFDEIKDLTEPQIAYEYYILLMKYKMIAAFTQNTMEEILFFGNEKLLDAVQDLKKQRKEINDEFKKQLQEVVSKIKTIEKKIKENNTDLKDLKTLQTSARLSSERIQQLLELGGEDAVKTNLTANKATLEVLKIQKKQIDDTKSLKINKINKDIKKLTGTVEEDEDEEEEVAEGKKKKKTKKKRKAGAVKILSNYNYSRNTRRLNPKSIKSVKSLKSLKSLKSVKSVKSVKSNFNYNYNCFILSLLLNKKYQPSVREIKQIIQNKFA